MTHRTPNAGMNVLLILGAHVLGLIGIALLITVCTGGLK